jgi:hypothetical protein
MKKYGFNVASSSYDDDRVHISYLYWFFSHIISSQASKQLLTKLD